MISHRRGRHRRSRRGLTTAAIAACGVAAVTLGLALGTGGAGVAEVRVVGRPAPDPASLSAPVLPTPTPADPVAAADPDAYNAPVPVDYVETAVARVIDGDSFVLPDGTRVRVLGTDSCEAGTPGGERATRDAVSLLHPGSGAMVRLRQGTRKLDIYGRALAYVELVDSRDFGSVMVERDHTAVYDGANDASPEYVAHVRALDTDGRACGDEGTNPK